MDGALRYLVRLDMNPSSQITHPVAPAQVHGGLQLCQPSLCDYRLGGNQSQGPVLQNRTGIGFVLDVVRFLEAFDDSKAPRVRLGPSVGTEVAPAEAIPLEIASRLQPRRLRPTFVSSNDTTDFRRGGGSRPRVRLSQYRTAAVRLEVELGGPALPDTLPLRTWSRGSR